MLEPSDVVVVDFPGARGVKRRPAVVLSTAIYHAHRPDVILGLLTTRVSAATAPTDYAPLDWSGAGLQQPSAFRSYLVTLEDGHLPSIGRLSERAWDGVRQCLRQAISFGA
jgi:mRNA interferase MazF